MQLDIISGINNLNNIEKGNIYNGSLSAILADFLLLSFDSHVVKVYKICQAKATTDHTQKSTRSN